MNNKTFSPWDIFLIAGFTATSLSVSLLTHSFEPISFIGGLCSILCVIYGAKGHMLNFLFGLIGSLILGYITFRSGVIGMALFYLLYNAPMQIIGCSRWKHRLLSPESAVIRTRWMTWGQRGLMVISTIALAAVLYIVLARLPNETQPLSDAAAVAVAAVSQLVLVLAFVEQWFLWIVLDLAMSVVWIVAWKNGTPYASIQFVLQLFYLINAFRGLYLWSRLEKE